MNTLSEDFMRKIAKAFEDEEMDIYTLSLYSIDSDDMNYFNEVDRQRVRFLFRRLMDDTRRHMELLKLIVEMGSG